MLSVVTVPSSPAKYGVLMGMKENREVERSDKYKRLGRGGCRRERREGEVNDDRGGK